MLQPVKIEWPTARNMPPAIHYKANFRQLPEKSNRLNKSSIAGLFTGT